jgi:hypothetical protein
MTSKNKIKNKKQENRSKLGLYLHTKGTTKLFKDTGVQIAQRTRKTSHLSPKQQSQIYTARVECTK